MKTLKEYTLSLLAFGKFFFNKQDVISELQLSPGQFRFQAYRLSQKGIVKRLISNFYMIIPYEYQQLGSLPPTWIIDALMKYLDQEYYIGLLSAASMYGATEQQPMVFQVITNKPMKNIVLERIKIEFHSYKYCVFASKTTIATPTGYAKISRREQTIVDLVRFYKVSGYLSNISMIIKSLAEEIDIKIFKNIVEYEQNNAILQRLGYILEINKISELATIIEKELSKRKIEYVYLRPDYIHVSNKKSIRWKLLLNDTVELS